MRKIIKKIVKQMCLMSFFMINNNKKIRLKMITSKNRIKLILLKVFLNKIKI